MSPSSKVELGSEEEHGCQVCTVQFGWFVQLQETVSKEVPVLNHAWEQEVMTQEAEASWSVLRWQRTVAHALQSAKRVSAITMGDDGRVPSDMRCLGVWNTASVEVRGTRMHLYNLIECF